VALSLVEHAVTSDTPVLQIALHFHFRKGKLDLGLKILLQSAAEVSDDF